MNIGPTRFRIGPMVCVSGAVVGIARKMRC